MDHVARSAAPLQRIPAANSCQRRRLPSRRIIPESTGQSGRAPQQQPGQQPGPQLHSHTGHQCTSCLGSCCVVAHPQAVPLKAHSLGPCLHTATAAAWLDLHSPTPSQDTAAGLPKRAMCHTTTPHHTGGAQPPTPPRVQRAGSPATASAALASCWRAQALQASPGCQCNPPAACEPRHTKAAPNTCQAVLLLCLEWRVVANGTQQHGSADKPSTQCNTDECADQERAHSRTVSAAGAAAVTAAAQRALAAEGVHSVRFMLGSCAQARGGGLVIT